MEKRAVRKKIVELYKEAAQKFLDGAAEFEIARVKEEEIKYAKGILLQSGYDWCLRHRSNREKEQMLLHARRFLMYCDGLTVEEIAAQHDVRTDTVRMGLGQFKERLSYRYPRLGSLCDRNLCLNAASKRSSFCDNHRPRTRRVKRRL